MKSLHLWLIVCLLVCSLVVINATTRKIYVNQRTGNDENNGSEHSPVRTIQRGVDIANSSDIVLLSSGAHYLYREVFINKTGITIQSLEADEVEPLVSSEDKLAVIVAFKVIGQVMFIHNAQNVSIRYVILRDATVWNLVETRPELDIPCGGALMISYSSFISVEHVKMQNNLAAYGGATCIYNSQNVTFTQCEITKNAAIIRNNVLHNELNNLRIGRVSNFNISNSDFFGNIPLYKTYSSDFGSGGGIAIMNSTGVTFYESIISNNTAADEGGALYIVGSTVHIERSQISGNIGFKQSSTIYSDISSDVYLDTIYFYENYCVHSQCRLLFSEKRSLLQDNLVFRKYVFPVVSVTGTVLSIVLLCVIPLYSLLMHVFRYISYRRLQKDQDVKEKKDRLIRSDRVVLWLFESFAIYYPEGTSNLRIFIHRSIVVVVIVLSTVYAGMSYASTFPLYYDEFDRIKYVFYVVEHIYYYFIPLVVFFGMIRAANLSAEKLFSSNYSKAFENSFDKETERQLLLMTNHVPQDEDEITTFHTNSRKRYNRRAIVAVIWAFAYANIMYAIVVVDVFNFVKSQRLISGIMQENVKLDTWTVSVFTLLHWYLSFCLISFMLCVLYLICNRINALTRLYFDELHYKLKTGTFTLQWGIEGFVKLRREQKILNNDTYPIAVTYAALFVILLGIETLVILWGQSENGYFIFYVISMVILLVTVTNVSYTANKFVSSNFDDFVLSAFEESQEMQQVQSTGKHDVTADASIVTILSNRDRMLRDLTHFHGYIRNRIFSYSFPYEANLQTSTVFTLISLGGFSYGLVKYLSSSIPSEFIYRQY